MLDFIHTSSLERVYWVRRRWRVSASATSRGAALKDERLDIMMGEGGIADCSKAGNCVVVCPKNIENLDSIATVGRQTFVHAIKRFFNE